MKKLYKILKNFLAMVGLLTIIGALFLFIALTIKTGLSPLDLTEKVIQKGLDFFKPVIALNQKKPAIDLNQFKPVGLSPHVSLTPVDEKTFYNRRILRIGPNRDLKLPSQAAAIAKPNDIIEIDAGIYKGDVALWKTPNLTIRGVNGRAVLDAAGRSYEGKAIWVVRTNDMFIENIAFKNCKVRDKNGAGIRLEGDNIKIRNCLFWANENGILGGASKSESTVTIKYSEFGFNGHGDGQSHGLYIGKIEKLIFEFNYVHHTRTGHHIKSRARNNQIRYNYLADHEQGNSSFAIDLENGGEALIIGNIIQQSKMTENSALIHYGMPNSKFGKPFFIINNTAISKRHSGIFVLNHSPAKGLIVNNLLVGKLKAVVGLNKKESNLSTSKSCFSFLPSYPYALNAACRAVNHGFIFNKTDTKHLVPRFEYAHPLSKTLRPVSGKIDIGAYEFN